MNKTVLITREVSQGKKTAEKLKKEGFQPILFPTIKFIRLPFNKEKILSSDVLVFTSQNAVEYFFKEVTTEKVKDKIFIATGEKTGKSLKKIGIENVLIPDQFTAEGVFQLIKDNKLYTKKFLIIRPLEGIKTLDERLKEIGAEFEVLPVYKTVENIPDNLKEVEKLIKKGKIDYVIFTSPSTFRNFLKLFKNPEKIMKNIKIAVIGSTTQKAVLEAGYNVDIIPEKYTLDHLIAKLKQQAF